MTNLFALEKKYKNLDELFFSYLENDLFASIEDIMTINGTSKLLSIIIQTGGPTWAKIIHIRQMNFKKSM